MTAYDFHPEDGFDPSTRLVCQNCNGGVMNVYSGPYYEDEGTAEEVEVYVLRCSTCGSTEEASTDQMNMGEW